MKNIFLFLVFFLTFSLSKASECYDYHTSRTYKLIKKDKSVFFQFTEKDPNGFSYVRQVNKEIKGIDNSTYKLLGEDEDNLMFADKNAYYILPKIQQYEDKKATYFKLLDRNVTEKQINGRLFLINKKWTYLDAYEKDITKIVLNELPENLSNIKCYTYGMYVKSDQQVFKISIDLSEVIKYNIEIIPNLNPKQTFYYAFNELNNEDYLADENHMFSIRREGSFEDITPQLLALGVKRKFNTLKLIDANVPLWYNENMLKKRDGASFSGKNPQTGEELELYYSYSSGMPLQPSFGKINYARFRNKIYPFWDDNFSNAYDVKTDVNQLVAIEGKLFRGKDFYYFEADNDLKIISTGISSDAQFFHGVYSYQKYLPKALVDEKYIHFIADRFSIHLDKKKSLNNKTVKQLGMFYLFNNALFDGENTYPIKADYETLIYLGSFVEVLNDCAGSMPNTPQVSVKYHHFFKDENAVYYFDETLKQLQIIQTADPNGYKTDNYDDLQNLYKIKDVKGTIKKKTKSNIKYYAIAVIVLILSALSFWLIRRKSKLK